MKKYMLMATKRKQNHTKAHAFAYERKKKINISKRGITI